MGLDSELFVWQSGRWPAQVQSWGQDLCQNRQAIKTVGAVARVGGSQQHGFALGYSSLLPTQLKFKGETAVELADSPCHSPGAQGLSGCVTGPHRPCLAGLGWFCLTGPCATCGCQLSRATSLLSGGASEDVHRASPPGV